MAHIGKCLICENTRELQLSHAIGDSVFRAITKHHSGKAILIDSAKQRISTTQESYPEHQLCKECEGKLNICFESPVLALLRGQKGAINDTFNDGYITFTNADAYQIKMYFLAIWFRAAKSSQNLYRNIVMLTSQGELIRKSLDNGQKVRAQDFPVRLTRLKNNGQRFDRDFITCFSDFSRKEPRVVFIFGGFSAEIYLEGLNQKRREELAVLNSRKSVLRLPVIDIREVFPLDYLHRYIHDKKEENNVDDSVLKMIKK